MTKIYGLCTRCGIHVLHANWGVELHNNHAGLDRHDDGILLCNECRNAFEDWLEYTPQSHESE